MATDDKKKKSSKNKEKEKSSTPDSSNIPRYIKWDLMKMHKKMVHQELSTLKIYDGDLETTLAEDHVYQPYMDRIKNAKLPVPQFLVDAHIGDDNDDGTINVEVGIDENHDLQCHPRKKGEDACEGDDLGFIGDLVSKLVKGCNWDTEANNGENTLLTCRDSDGGDMMNRNLFLTPQKTMVRTCDQPVQESNDVVEKIVTGTEQGTPDQEEAVGEQVRELVQNNTLYSLIITSLENEVKRLLGNLEDRKWEYEDLKKEHEKLQDYVDDKACSSITQTTSLDTQAAETIKSLKQQLDRVKKRESSIVASLHAKVLRRDKEIEKLRAELKKTRAAVGGVQITTTQEI